MKLNLIFEDIRSWMFNYDKQLYRQLYCQLDLPIRGKLVEDIKNRNPIHLLDEDLDNQMHNKLI